MNSDIGIAGIKVVLVEVVEKSEVFIFLLVYLSLEVKGFVKYLGPLS